VRGDAKGDEVDRTNENGGPPKSRGRHYADFVILSKAKDHWRSMPWGDTSLRSV